MLEPGDLIHVDDGRAVVVVDATLADWPRIDDDGTVRCVVVRTRPAKGEEKPRPILATDPRCGITERIRAAVGRERRAA